MERDPGDRLIHLFEAALDATAGERDELLASVRSEDPELAEELESLLRAHGQSSVDVEAIVAAVLPDLLPDVMDDLASAKHGSLVEGRYRLLERLGRGGMGEVWRAHDVILDRPVALKFLSVSRSTAEDRARILGEARSASKLDHPAIAVVHEVGTIAADSGAPGAGQLYIAMAYCPGETLARRLAAGPLEPGAAVDIAIQLADALAAAHAAGVVHRDIKPANLILTPAGQVKVVDFGLAARIETDRRGAGPPGGTPAYMSPEHARHEAVDERSDIWSLGVVLYEMLAGRRPFPGRSRGILAGLRRREHVELTGLPTAVPDAVRAVIRRCLEPRPEDRFADAAAARDALRASLVSEGASTSDPAASTGARALVPLRATAAVAVVVGLAAVGTAYVRSTAAAGAGASAEAASAAHRIAVLPFAPVAADTALERLGRWLSVAVASGLDGMGELEAVDVLDGLQGPESGRRPDEDDVAALAREVGAGRVVRGRLTRRGGALNVDVSLHRAGDPVAIVRASARADEPEALADAAVVALLDELWRREPPPAPSLAAIRESRDPAARRAYLAGEMARLRADMPAALEAFERAFEADTSFWWAYWRSMYVRAFREVNAPPDTALLRKVLAHRHELAEPDRLLVEVATLDSRREALVRLRELTTRFERYSPGWWSYANLLVHDGPFLGETADEARYALERFLELQPGSANGWDHLHWVAMVLGDPATATRAARAADSLAAGVPSRRLWGRVLALRAAVPLSGPLPPDALAEALDITRSAPPFLAQATLEGLVADGRPAAQLQVNAAARDVVRPELVTASRRGDALAWAGRGAWEPALAAARVWARESGGEDGELGAYRLAAAGAALGFVAPGRADELRPPSGRAVGWSPAGRAELAWLDGVMAFVRRDPSRIAAARAEIAAVDPELRWPLDRSLAALATAVRGDPARASRELVALEADVADGPLRTVLGRHPAFSTVHRLLAASWLRDAGEDREAAVLLTWFEAIPTAAVTHAWLRGLGGVALLDRAEIALAAGEYTRAHRYLRRFDAQYDLAVPALRERADRVARAVASEAR